MLYPAKLRLAMLVLLLWTVAMTSARTLPSRSKQVKVYSYVLPAGAEEIRDDINHSFACGNRSDGFYVDIDNDCQIFHRCQDKARFSFICAERTVFSQMYQTCVHDGQLGFPCEDSAQYYPEGEGYEPTGAESQPAKQTFQPEQQPDAAPQELEETPQSPSKSSEISKPQSTGVQDDVPMIDPMQNAMRPAMVVKDDEYRPADQPAYQQVSADLFDSVDEEDPDVPSENSAQEIVDEPEPVAVGATEEAGSIQTTSGEDTQEVEVMDEPTQQVPTLASEPSVVPIDVTANVEVENSPTDDTNAADGVESTSYKAEISPPGVPHLAAASLLNAVQMVEELEPIVHDLGVEENENLPPQLSTDGQAVNAMPTSDTALEDNEVLPEMGTPVANMVAAPTADTVDEHVIPVAILFDSDVESGEKVSDLSPEPLSSAEKIGESSEPEAIVSGEYNELIPVFTPPEVADVIPEVIHGSGSELPVSDVEDTLANDLKAPQLSERPLESPAIAEEMLPQRSHGELPELIVSTEFHLDSVTKRAPIRRRKTFLFRADAIRAKV
ncbi:uncharacterized protein LOC128266968 [Anopheles cruzii]|uniref:uncharacterized protein LOC128266968 n=1 Tax=Anopheles cruzii TaxID=68878 RepID=UPI0022EC412A|nr:uncharacterized protein LOC128266968 [Anopheles cruzii]